MAFNIEEFVASAKVLTLERADGTKPVFKLRETEKKEEGTTDKRMLLSTIGLSEDMTKSLEAIGVTDVKVEKGEFWGSVPSSVSFRNNASDFDKVNRTWVVNGKPVIKQTGKTAAYDSYMYISIISETPPIRSADESKNAKLNQEWRKRLHYYNIAIETTVGCGERGQMTIDYAWDSMLNFVNGNKGCGYIMPESKHVCKNFGI